MTHPTPHPIMMAILVASFMGMTLSGCGKTEESIPDVAPPSKETAASKEPATPAPKPLDPQQLMSENQERWNKLSTPVEGFIRRAQRDLSQAASEYGGKEMQDKLSSLGKAAALTYQASMQSIVVGLGNSVGERPAVMFYHPITDLLIVTRWTWDGKIVESHFTTGNYFLGADDSAGLPFFSDFRSENNLLGRVVLITTRVREKFWQVYPGLDSAPAAEVRDIPAEALNKKLMLLAEVIKVETQWKTEANSKLLQKFQDAWIKGDVNTLEGMMPPDSIVKAESLMRVPEKHRTMTVINHFEPPGSARHVFMAHPELYSTWYYLVVGLEGKVVVSTATDLTLTSAALK